MARNSNVPDELESIVDKVLAYDPDKQQVRDDSVKPKVETWTTSVKDILGNESARLDATHYDPRASRARELLERSDYNLKPLSALASVSLRGQFTRIWADDSMHGYPYLNATDLLSLMSLGVPSGGPRFLSKATETDVEALLIKEGWMLMTCSGTIGRLFYVPERLDGWVATHDLIRIVPNDESMTGFLLAWLSTDLAQAQILSYVHGGQIDHVTDAQVAETLVPILPDATIKRLNTNAMKALESREQAIEQLLKIREETENAVRSQ